MGYLIQRRCYQCWFRSSPALDLITRHMMVGKFAIPKTSKLSRAADFVRCTSQTL